MRHGNRRHSIVLAGSAGALALITAGAGAQTGSMPSGDAPAEPPAPQERETAANQSRSPLSFAITGNAQWVFASDLDGSEGEVSIARAGADVTAIFAFSRTDRVILSVGEEFSFYEFSDADVLDSGEDPIGDASDTSINLTYTTKVSDRWGLTATAGARFSAETGAEFSDSLVGSGVVIATYDFNDRLTAGGGVLVRTRLEEDVLVIPIATVNWKINDRWTLSNTGGSAGVRFVLAYKHSDAWTLTGDVGFEGREFRLDEDGPIPGGVARDTRLPIALGARYNPSPKLTFSLRAGAHFLQELEFDDNDGDEVVETDVDPTGFISFMASLRL